MDDVESYTLSPNVATLQNVVRLLCVTRGRMLSRKFGALGPRSLGWGSAAGLLETRPTLTWFVTLNLVVLRRKV